MKDFLRRVNSVLINSGINLRQLGRSIVSLPGFWRDYRKFRQMAGNDFGKINLFPCLADKFETGGTAKGHYFHQDLLVARKVFESKPVKHVDVGSRVDGFVAHVASFREIEVFDIRPNDIKIPNILFKQADFMKPLPEEYHNYCDSVSCLHALEHFGLGRYCDPIDPKGYLQGLENLYQLLMSNGKLYLSVPIGHKRIEFNAHRVFDAVGLRKIFTDKFEVLDCSIVDDEGNLSKFSYEFESEFEAGFDYGCAILTLKK